MGKSGHRLSFLIVEAEPAQGLSTRKLLLESAKHNVITAYSATEGIEMFKRFPKVDVVVIDGELKGNCRLAKEVKQHHPTYASCVSTLELEQKRIGLTKLRTRTTRPRS